MRDHILTVLVTDNPWLEGESVAAWAARFVPDPYFPRRVTLEPGELASVIVGPRQAGKSTLVWKTIAEEGEPCLLLNCEEPAMREWLVSPASVLADLKELGWPARRLFLDEVQHLDEAGLFIKGLVDRRAGLQLFVSGSSAFDLEAGTRESLAGRSTRELLLPLAIGEVAATLPGQGALRTRKLRALVERFSCFGGYPVIHTGKDPERLLGRLVEAFIIQDASDRLRIRHIAAFRRLLELMASQIGNLCNYSEWASLTGVSNDTVAGYAHLLEETHIVRLLRPFAGGRRAEITSTPKAYFHDNGIRNRLFGGFAPPAGRADAGALLENLVFTELSKTLNPLLDGLHFWRSKSGAEVDFVLSCGGRLAACEVKAGGSRGRIPRASRSFIEAYQPECFWMVGFAPPADPSTLTIGETQVRFIPVWDLHEQVSAFRRGGR
jgi:predicted AAA+ superfamily ATPase